MSGISPIPGVHFHKAIKGIVMKNSYYVLALFLPILFLSCGDSSLIGEVVELFSIGVLLLLSMGALLLLSTERAIKLDSVIEELSNPEDVCGELVFSVFELFSIDTLLLSTERVIELDSLCNGSPCSEDACRELTFCELDSTTSPIRELSPHDKKSMGKKRAST